MLERVRIYVTIRSLKWLTCLSEGKNMHIYVLLSIQFKTID